MRDSSEMAVGVGYAFNVLPTDCVAGIELKESGIVVTVNGNDYPLLKGATFEDSQKVDALLDAYGQFRTDDFIKPKEPAVSLDSETVEALAASADARASSRHRDHETER